MSLSEILSVAHSLIAALLKCRMFSAQWGRGAFKDRGLAEKAALSVRASSFF